MSRIVRFGIIGMGIIGCRHAESLLSGRIENAELVAFTSRNPQDVLTKLTIPDHIRICGTVDQILQENVDAVIVATPHPFHPEHAMKAFSAGKHVLIEKPAGTYLRDVASMNKAAEASSLKFAIMLNLRILPVYRVLNSLIKSGKLGTIKRVVLTITDMYRSNYYYRSSPWRSSWKGSGGGLLINQIIHHLDICQWLFGLPDTVTAMCDYGLYHSNIDIDDGCMALFTYDNGLRGALIASTGEAPGIERLEISCDLGLLIYDDGKLVLHEAEAPEPVLRERDVKPYDRKVPYIIRHIDIPVVNTSLNEHEQIIANFTRSILYDEILIAPGADGLASLELACGIYLSDWEKRPVTMPIDHEYFDQMLDKRFSF